jgi:alginate O-acetyltransferase complex protein AlgI
VELDSGQIIFGVVLTWGLARQAMHLHPLLAGWVGMTKLIFCLHFGTFHLLALVWRRLDVPVEPLMNHPYRAVTLAEFWGQRWNRAYHRLTQDLVFARLSRRLGPRVAPWAGFLASGLIHEFVITVPARGGYGRPTLYFPLQAAGLAWQRSAPVRRRGFHRGVRGWCWTMLFVAPPAIFLFPPPFVERVMLPFLKAIVAF